MNINLIQAKISDVEIILDIMDMARNYQRSLGFIQWEDDYPNRAIIEQDITMGDAYVFIEEDQIVGYCVLPIGDSAYDELSNTWHNKGVYGVVHRLAFSDKIRGKGYSTGDFADSQAFYDAVLQERGHELWFEGARREDLIRHGKYIEYARLYKGSKTAQDYMVLFPLPQDVINEGRGKVHQNPGY